MLSSTYNINQLTELSLERIMQLKAKYEYETPQFPENSREYQLGVDALVKLEIEIERREKEGQP
tara:strand:- start:3700 stop:3891 length:192 start_codon:yes stop_codon:yes gene_type:complete